MKIISQCIPPVKLVLLLLCIYATTEYSVNPKQRECKHAYTGLKYLYFTNISLYLTILTSILCIIYRAAGIFARAMNLTLALSPVFNYITTITFWSLYYTKRELIVNKQCLRPGYETYLITELSLHLFPFILIFLEQVNIRVKKARSHYYVLLGILMSYCAAVHIAAWYKGCFIYGFLNIMPALIRILFFVGMYGCCIVFYSISMVTNRLCNKGR